MPIPAYIRWGAAAGLGLAALLVAGSRKAEENNSKYNSNKIEFKPNDPRDDEDIRPLFECVAGRRVVMKIMDPYCVLQQRHRKLLAKFVTIAIKARVNIVKLIIVWDPTKEEVDKKGYDNQKNAMLAEFQSAGVRKVPLEFEKKFHGKNSDFHDRCMFTCHLEDGDDPSLTKWTLTGGIDRLMNQMKACSVIIEENTTDDFFPTSDDINELLRKPSASRRRAR